MSYHHEPVLLQEVLHALNLTPGSTVIDCTIGGGGHTEAILEKTAPDGRVLGIDRDLDAIHAVQERLAGAIEQKRLVLVHDRFDHLAEHAEENNFTNVDAILFDLGASSHHFDTSTRGFSFLHDGPLDMRYDTSEGKTAADIINHTKEKELISIFRTYGEERYAGRIVDAIIAERRSTPITSTVALAELIQRIVRKAGSLDMHIHPATRVFQALRIAVNDELGALGRALPQTLSLLKKGGRLAIITFHSIEDHIVKDFFRKEARECLCPKEFPICRCSHTPQLTLVTKKGISPSVEELKRNPRARSATLRVAEKI
ncbi:16S rRNA (cytosine(1402)-N(4))-methyltransferase RsmH [Candidatus Uhrbacteria bacterium]|nr:16S rRNA (cytosine(1402)-N(4))-methyltransferase RsmH [Candidatus Uhrbacteria bacterium]